MRFLVFVFVLLAAFACVQMPDVFAAGNPYSGADNATGAVGEGEGYTNATTTDTGVGSGTGLSLREDIENLLRGNIGVLAGLIISLVGMWVWLFNQNSVGLVIVICGAAVPAMPEVFDSFVDGFRAAFSNSVQE